MARAGSQTNEGGRLCKTDLQDRNQQGSMDKDADEHVSSRTTDQGGRIPDRSVRMQEGGLARGHADTSSLLHWGSIRTGSKTDTLAYAEDCIRVDTRI